MKNPYKNTEQDIGESRALLEDVVNTAFQSFFFFSFFLGGGVNVIYSVLTLPFLKTLKAP